MPHGEPTHGWWCNARTYRTRCKYCNDPVFFFTCDCGSKVFFDELGWPWPEHRCVQYLTARYGKKFIEHAMSVQMTLPGRSAIEHRINSDYATIVRQRGEKPRPPDRCIVRCDPLEGQAINEVGIVREISQEVDVFKKMDIVRAMVGVQILGPLGCGKFGQITIHTGDLAHEDAKSYTCFLNRALLRSSRINVGDIVSFDLRAFSVPGRRVVWICERLGSLLP